MIITLRCIFIFLLLTALLDPQLETQVNSQHVVLLIDDSLSMAKKLESSRWKKISARLRSIPPETQLTIIRYAATATAELARLKINSTEAIKYLSTPHLPRYKPLIRLGSNLKQALNFSHQFILDEHPSSFVIIHDRPVLSLQAQQAINKLKSRGHSFYELNLATPQDVADSWIQDFYIPTWTQAQHKIPVSISLSSNRDASAILQISLDNSVLLEKTLQLTAGKTTPLQFLVNACHASSCKLTAKLFSEQDDIPENNQRSAMINVLNSNAILYIHDLPKLPKLARNLLSQEFSVTLIKPTQCFTNKQSYSAYNSIVLDDIAYQALSTDCWRSLQAAVRQSGLGLLVLGGPHSFSSGAYRHSALEKLLPVTAEPATPIKPRNIIFVLDTSGSMGSTQPAQSRLSSAKQVIESITRSLQAQDNYALISFDVNAQLISPLQNHAFSTQWLQENVTDAARGGTRIVPALQLAVDEFNKTATSEDKIIILISDGHFDAAEISSAEKIIADNKFDVISLAFGNRANASRLKNFSRINNGTFIPLNSMNALPALLHKELEQRRPLIHQGAASVSQRKQLPFFQINQPWPKLSGYQLSKAKNMDSIYLHSQHGDPIIALHNAGLGRVIAIPSGFEYWSEAWHTWSHSTDFFKNMLEWLNASQQQDLLDLKLEQADNTLTLIMNALSNKHEWLDILSTSFKVTTPEGKTQIFPIQITAPGKAQSTIQLPHTPGIYTFSIKLETLSSSFKYLHEPYTEFLPIHMTSNNNVAQIVLPEFYQSNIFKVPHKFSFRILILLLTLLCYILLLALQLIGSDTIKQVLLHLK